MCIRDRWETIEHRYLNPDGNVTIGLVGKYNTLADSYKSLIEALTHGAISNNVRLNLKSLDSELFTKKNRLNGLSNVNAILIQGGFGSRGTDGKINAASYARKNKIPFLGICLGMQIAIIEAARNMANLKDANSTEFSKTKNPVIGIMTEWVKKNKKITKQTKRKRY